MSGQTVTVTSESSTRAPRRLQPRHLVIAVLLCVVIGSVYALVRQSQQNAISLDGGVIERLIPAPGLKILKQDAIGVDLAPGYEASLAIDGVPIPASQLTVIAQLGQYTLNPLVGTEYESLPTGNHCATVTYWTLIDGPAQSTSRSWCFTVL